MEMATLGKVPEISEFQPNRKIGILFAFGSLLLLGLMPIITNSRPKSLDTLAFTFYLSIWQLVAALPLLLLEPYKGNHGIFSSTIDRRNKKRTYVIVIGTGLIFLLSTFLYIYSFEKAGTINAAIALQAYPLWATILEAIFLRKIKSLKEITFTITLVLGLIYLGTEGTWKISNISIWFALAICVPLLWSIAHIIIRHTISNSPISPGQITFFRVLVATIVLLPIISVTRNPSSILEGISKQYQLFAVAMGVVYYLELVSWFNSIKHIEVSVASSITTVSPIITMILAIIILKEKIFGYQLISLSVVLFSLYSIILFGKTDKELEIVE